MGSRQAAVAYPPCAAFTLAAATSTSLIRLRADRNVECFTGLLKCMYKLTAKELLLKKDIAPYMATLLESLSSLFGPFFLPVFHETTSLRLEWAKHIQVRVFGNLEPDTRGALIHISSMVSAVGPESRHPVQEHK